MVGFWMHLESIADLRLNLIYRVWQKGGHRYDPWPMRRTKFPLPKVRTTVRGADSGKKSRYLRYVVWDNY